MSENTLEEVSEERTLGNTRIPLLGKGGVDATSKKYREASFERSGRGGWFKPPTISGSFNQPPRLRQLRMLRGIFFMAQPPLLSQGGVYSGPLFRPFPASSACADVH